MYMYPGGTPSISEVSAPSLSPGGTGGILGGYGIRFGVGCVRQSDGGAPMLLHLNHVCRLCAVPY
jgi:hypothetical protein